MVRNHLSKTNQMFVLSLTCYSTKTYHIDRKFTGYPCADREWNNVEHASTEKKDDLNDCFDWSAPVQNNGYISKVSKYIYKNCSGHCWREQFSKCFLILF